jgi:O-antigen/teichoic acid export membrane protein
MDGSAEPFREGSASGSMTQSQRIVKNVVAGGLSTAIGGLLQLITVVLVARRLSIDEFGSYSLMLAFAFTLQRLSDLGVSNILMRDMAVRPRDIPQTLGGALALAWVTTAAFAALMSVGILALRFNQEIGLLTAIMGIGGASQFQCGLYGATLRSQEDNELQALGFVLHKFIVLAMISCFVLLGLTLRAVVLSHIIAYLFQWLFYRWLVIHRYARPKLHIDLELWKYLIVSSVPLGASGVVRLLAEQADIMILTWLTDPRMVALFSGPYKIAAGLRFIPQAMMLAAYPLYARAASSSGTHAEFREAYERGLKGFVLLAFPVALIFLFYPGPLTLGLLGGRYADSVPAMRLLSIGVFALFIASPFPLLITALNRQRFLLVSSSIAFVIRVTLDFVLTPHWGFLAPCLALAVSESVLVAMWIGCLWQAGFPAPLSSLVWRPCIAGALMAPLLYAIHPHSLLLLAAGVLPAVIAYLIVLVMLGAFPRDELKLIREGMGFVRPFWDSCSRQLQGRAS